jgi:S1-C subfamily serine protease
LINSRQHYLTTRVVNSIVITATTIFITYLLWQIFVPNVGHIAKAITVRIDGTNTGSGVIIQQQGDLYTVLSNWHVVSDLTSSTVASPFTITTTDRQKHLVPAKNIVRVGKLDLATLEFRSSARYPVAAIGNSDRLAEGQFLYISGWAVFGW